MIGIDTNVLIRYYVNDNAAQHKKAKAFIDTNEIYVTHIVLIEMFWVFKKVYELTQQEIEAIFSHLLRLSNLHLENELIIALAIKKYSHFNCDLADAIIAITHEQLGYETVTFDKMANAKLGMRLL